MPATTHHSPESEFVSMAALARALGCSESTARRKCDSGEVQSRRTDSGVRVVTRDELERVRREVSQ
jgi:hypothetical protein